MLRKETHQLIMGRILLDIYADVSLSSLLGFKGGTCALFFYNLPRFSVDLDFDLLSEDVTAPQRIFSRMPRILTRYGVIKDAHIKQHTLFFLLSYGERDHNIKIEINTRLPMPHMQKYFGAREYFGVSVLVGTQEYLFSSKLAALTLRKKVAMRDIYDIWYFAKENWGIDEKIVFARTSLSVPEYLRECVLTIERVGDNEILSGLGELLPGEKVKDWVKNHLRTEARQLLSHYASVLGRKEKSEGPSAH